jgi:DNA-binding protein H-NS
MAKPNIKGLSAGELLSLRNDIDYALGNMAKELEKQLVQIKGLPAQTRGAPVRKKRGPPAGRKLAAKYRNPENKSETWAGRGMKPKWLVIALKSGKKLEAFAVKK